MQYILSEEEYNELKHKATENINKAVKWNQELCTKIADEMPVIWGWGGNDYKPWGCILSQSSKGYCDECPVQDVCPNERKEWSK